MDTSGSDTPSISHEPSCNIAEFYLLVFLTVTLIFAKKKKIIISDVIINF